MSKTFTTGYVTLLGVEQVLPSIGCPRSLLQEMYVNYETDQQGCYQ